MDALFGIVKTEETDTPTEEKAHGTKRKHEKKEKKEKVKHVKTEKIIVVETKPVNDPLRELGWNNALKEASSRAQSVEKRYTDTRKSSIVDPAEEVVALGRLFAGGSVQSDNTEDTSGIHVHGMEDLAHGTIVPSFANNGTTTGAAANNKNITEPEAQEELAEFMMEYEKRLKAKQNNEHKNPSDSDADVFVQEKAKVLKREKELRKQRTTLANKLRRRVNPHMQALTGEQEEVYMEHTTEEDWKKPMPDGSVEGIMLPDSLKQLEESKQTWAKAKHVRNDLDFSQDGRQKADRLMPLMYQRVTYPMDEDASKGDPDEARVRRPRLGATGEEFFGMADGTGQKKGKRKRKDGTTAGSRPGVTFSTQQPPNSVEVDFDTNIVMTFRTTAIERSYQLDALASGQRAWAPAGAEKTDHKQLAAKDQNSREFEDSMLVEPEPGEPACCEGSKCAGCFVPHAIPVILKACFTKAERMRMATEAEYMPPYPRPCLMCKRDKAFYMFVNCKAENRGMPSNHNISSYYNIPDMEGEYALEQMIMSSSHEEQALPLPIVMNHNHYYKQIQLPDGRLGYKQTGYYKPCADVQKMKEQQRF